MKNPIKIISFLVFFFIISPVKAEVEHYCDDAGAWEQWDALVQKYPTDSDVQRLHALRLGLCMKIKRGDITVEQATIIFDQERAAVFHKKKTEEEKNKEIILGRET